MPLAGNGRGDHSGAKVWAMGFEAKWDGLYTYTANANRYYALCNIPTITHAWRTRSTTRASIAWR